MRILLVVHGFPPAASGGTEWYVHDLAYRLCRRPGDEVLVLARESDGERPQHQRRRERRGPLQVEFVNNTFPPHSPFERSYRSPEVRAVVARLLDEFRPDVAHVHHLTGLGTDVLDEISQRGIASVFTLHDYWLLCQRGQLLDLELERCEGPTDLGCARCLHGFSAPSLAARVAGGLLRLRTAAPPIVRPALRRAAFALRIPAVALEAVRDRERHVRSMCDRVTRFLAPSRTLMDRFLAAGVPAERSTQWKLGVEHERFGTLQRPASDRLRIGFVGSLMASKGPHLLLEAAARLPEGAASVLLYGPYSAYHGDDRYRRTLDRLSNATGVTPKGSLAREQIPELLASLDVLVVPSIWIENAPLVIQEAFLAGIPVVAANLGGMAELVEDGRNGLLFRAGDAAALQRALRRLIDEPGLLEQLRSGIPEVKSMEQDALETRALYEDLVARVSRNRRT